MSHLYLIRGLPGSGKSTFAEALAASFGYDHYEADDYFYKWNGFVWVYEFDSSKLHLAHNACQFAADRAMGEGDDAVVISNTFTTEKELKPYLKLAEKHDYRVTTMIIENRHGNKSIHGVPEETMTKMRNRFSVKL